MHFSLALPMRGRLFSIGKKSLIGCLCLTSLPLSAQAIAAPLVQAPSTVITPTTLNTSSTPHNGTTSNNNTVTNNNTVANTNTVTTQGMSNGQTLTTPSADTHNAEPQMVKVLAKPTAPALQNPLFPPLPFPPLPPLPKGMKLPAPVSPAALIPADIWFEAPSQYKPPTLSIMFTREQTLNIHRTQVGENLIRTGSAIPAKIIGDPIKGVGIALSGSSRWASTQPTGCSVLSLGLSLKPFYWSTTAIVVSDTSKQKCR